MSFAKVYTRALFGLDAPQIEVEVHLSQGLPALTIVGLPEGAVRESKDRVRSAILNSGFSFPSKRLTINLAPADLPKDGSRLDLAIAIGILIASGQITAEDIENYEFVGELSLDGQLRPINGVLSIAMACQNAKHQLVLPQHNASLAAKLTQLTLWPASNLKDVVMHLNQQQVLTPYFAIDSADDVVYSHDLAQVQGQLQARRALEIAAAGCHSVLFQGPPGSGKTLLASCLPSILPPLSLAESLSVANIYSVAQQHHRFGQRPFRAPHHTASAVALVGGGSSPKPGEITLAHLGVLFLDELPEFDRRVLEVLRQPLEAKQVVISRANRQVTFPANFQLIAAMNPCPCGYHFHQDQRCQCSAQMIQRYQAKISGPLLDRIDLHVNVPPLPSHDLQQRQPAESSAMVKQRVITAYQQQLQRQSCVNAALNPQQLNHYVHLDVQTTQFLVQAQQRLNLSARGYHRILRVARTIADLANAEQVQQQHLAEALSYRGLN